jgi:hypothetical protein
MENMIKVRHQRKCNADPLKANRRKAHVPCKSGPSTNIAVAQTNLGTDHAKTVARGANPSAVAPYHHLLGPSSSGGALMMPGSVHVGFHFYLSQNRP